MTTSSKRYLIASDFDETLFHTVSSPSPNHIDVNKAYQLGLNDIFGDGAGEWFFKQFGLQGRTPSEVIMEMLNYAPTHQKLIDNSKDFFDKTNGNFDYPIPECENRRLIWNNDSPQATITQMLVGQKLAYLLREIGKVGVDGSVWPRPCEGALDFIHIVNQLKQEGKPVDFAIISSGHESFIKRALDTWDAPQPDILVTEDDIRPRQHPQDPERRFKPGVFPLALTHYKWLAQQKLTGKDGLVHEGNESKKRIAFVGDDQKKDMLMAQQGGVEGFYYPQTSWQTLGNALLQNKDRLDGRPIREILRPQQIGVEAFAVGARKERR